MEKIEIFSKLKKALLNENRKEIFEIYLYTIKNGFSDKEVITKLMEYMYKNNDSEKYINLLRLYGSNTSSDSDIAYFVGFYFLMKKSYFHALCSFKLVDKYSIYYTFAQKNIKKIESNELKLLTIIKNETDGKNERLKNIEENVYKTVNRMINYAKSNKDGFKDY